MAQKKKTKAMVVSQKKLADGIYDLRLETELAQDAACGQFVGVYPKDKSTLLPRPISICEIDKEKNQLRLVYRVAGKGTAEFSNLKTGDSVYLLGVLGNGFPVDKAKPGTKAMLLAAESAFLRFYSCLKSFPVKNRSLWVIATHNAF